MHQIVLMTALTMTSGLFGGGRTQCASGQCGGSTWGYQYASNYAYQSNYYYPQQYAAPAYAAATQAAPAQVAAPAEFIRP